jgi:chorismate mutase
MDTPEVDATIRSLRDQLDALDRQLVKALNERARLVHELADIKAEAGAQLFDPKREAQMLQRVASENPGPIYDATIQEIFEVIMHRTRDAETS